MQNQIALYLIFATGILIIIGAFLDSDYLFGSKVKPMNSAQSTKGFSGIFSKLLDNIAKVFSVFEPKKGEEIDIQRRNKRILFVIFGVAIILLGIFALNSGKFS